MLYWDPSDPAWSTNPGPLFDQLREEVPVHLTPDGAWVLARHADCLSVLRDKSSSSDSLTTHADKRPRSFNGSGRQAERELIEQTGVDNRPFLFRDPPDHTRLRGLVQRAFTPRRVNELAPFIASAAGRVIDAHLDGGTFDAVQDLAWSVPVAVICELLDIPASDHSSFQDQSARLARGLDPDFLLTEEDRATRDGAILHFISYFSDLYAQRRAHPGDDLLSALVAARDGDDALSEGELLTTAILLLVAGHETTMNLISGSLLALDRDHDAQRALRTSGVDRVAVDELLRMVSPVQLTARTILRDMTFDGQTIPEGSFVLLLVGAANRDPDVFDDPTRLQVTRDPNPQLGFGFGLHHCLGAPLARLEAQIVLQELFARTSSYEIVSPPHYRPNIVLRGLDRLDLVLHP